MELMILDYDPYNPLPVDENQRSPSERVKALESRYTPTKHYKIDNESRKKGLDVIFKYSKSKRNKSDSANSFDPFIPYLAVTYFDRYFSREKFIPKLARNIFLDDLQLFALGFLTIAWKLRDRSFSINELKNRHPALAVVTPLQFDIVEIQILKSFKWSMHVVTPLCFLPLLEPMLDSPCHLVRKIATKLIRGSAYDHEFVAYRPSVLAASALLIIAEHLYCQGDQVTLYFYLNSAKIVTKAEGTICKHAMDRVCENLKRFRKIGVKKNEDVPISELVSGEELLQVTGRTFEKSTSRESEEVKTEEEPSNDSKISKRSADKGKEKVAEDTQLDSPLRCRTGEPPRQVHSDLEPDPVVPYQMKGVNERDQVMPNQGHVSSQLVQVLLDIIDRAQFANELALGQPTALNE